jgi:predicted dehydrogenase
MAMRIGVVGYGTGGRNFHTPYIEAADGIELAGVVARSPERLAQVREDWPNVEVHPTLDALLASGVDAVTITTPPTTRRELVLQALAAGVHVVADKPLAPSASDARELADAAEKSSRMLSVYHNRRWDADIRTLSAVITSGRLGEVWRLHSRFDADDPATLEGGPGGGLLRDIGSHLVDQALWLLGPAQAVTAHLTWADTDLGLTDGGFLAVVRHTSGAVSVLESTKNNHLQCRELRAYGAAGSYRALGSDVQATAIFAGRRPAADPEAWGYEPRAHWGVLATAEGEIAVPSEQGRYFDFYTQFAAAARSEAEQPVPIHEGIRTLEVIDAARLSAERGATIELVPS